MVILGVKGLNVAVADYLKVKNESKVFADTHVLFRKEMNDADTLSFIYSIKFIVQLITFTKSRQINVLNLMKKPNA